MLDSPLWEILRTLENAYQVHVRRVMERYGLSAAEVNVLLFLANNEGRNTAADIVSKRRIAKSHVSAAVDGLCRRGYLVRQPDAANARRIRLLLTDEAAAAVQFGQAEQRAFLANLTAGLPPAQEKQLEQTLGCILENARRQYSAPKRAERAHGSGGTGENKAAARDRQAAGTRRRRPGAEG